ncbi:MAG: RdgB/HAM1 family non-canonical purine NTP pyrophosphatase [Steroidobacteraceae bacterium]
MRLVLATANPGKQREFQALLEPLGFSIQMQSDLGIESVAETGTTFIDNALLKARHATRLAGAPALADDSGIQVDALEGRPGVHSARYAGDYASDAENLALLLRELANVPEDQRGACYQCAIVFVRSAEDPAPLVARGEWRGRIIDTPRGGHGFGYDPAFVPDGATHTVAEMPATQKNLVSHRARALASLLAQLEGG